MSPPPTAYIHVHDHPRLDVYVSTGRSLVWRFQSCHWMQPGRAEPALSLSEVVGAQAHDVMDVVRAQSGEEWRYLSWQPSNVDATLRALHQAGLTWRVVQTCGPLTRHLHVPLMGG